MFDAHVDADTLAQALDSVSALVNECKINLTEDGLAVRAVDPANVGMVYLELTESAFEAYDADGGVIGLNLSKLEDIVGMASTGQLIHLNLDEATRKLNIEFNGLEYNLSLIDPDSVRDEPDNPDIELSSEVVMEGADLNRAVEASVMVSDHVTFGVDEDDNQFYVTAQGDTDDINLELGPDELIELSAGDAESVFSLDYLENLSKPINKDRAVRTELGDEFPMKMHFDIAEGDGNVTYILAPRIEN